MLALVADDDPEFLDAVATALNEHGMQVRRAKNGAELLQCLAADGPFDLVVTDISMPWLDGLAALYHVRNAGLTMPVIVMTALPDDEIGKRGAMLRGNVVWLRKPFELGELFAATSSLLNPK